MKRLNNKILLIIFSVLIAAFVVTRLFRSPARESNLDKDALSVDTATIDQVNILPVADGRKEIKLIKEGKRWNVSNDQVTAPADKDRVNTMLQRLASMKPERLVTRKQDKWDDYQVGDTTGTTVIVLANGREMARVTVGKDQMNTTFVRKNGRDDVYAVEGSIASSFNQQFNNWRDPAFLRVNVDNIKKITFVYPADSSFVLSKNGNRWMVDNEAADSAKTVAYLNKLRIKEINEFADGFSEDSPSDVTVTIESGASPVTVKGWRNATGIWILASDLQPGVYFSDEQGRVAKDIFWGQSRFRK